MKIRSDFVTNSSSSSYCVSYEIETDKEDEEIELETFPDRYDPSYGVQIGVKGGLDSLIAKIKGSSSLEELMETIISRIDLDDIIEMDKAFHCEVGIEEDYKKIIEKFKQDMSGIKDLSGVKCVNIIEYIYGWGESSSYTFMEFMEDGYPDGLDWSNLDAIKKALEGRFDEELIPIICTMVKYNFLPDIEASIVTHIDLKTGEIEKEYIADTEEWHQIAKMLEEMHSMKDDGE